MTRTTLGLALLCALALPAAAKRPITAADIHQFRWVADPQISPEGTQVAYTLVTVNAKKDGYDTALHIVSATGGPTRRLTAGPRDSSPRWSPDGKRIAFLRAGEKDSRPTPAQVFLLPMQGGEAAQLTDLAKGASSPVWAPDGRAIAFTSTTLPKDSEKKEKADEISDVRVINRAVYRFNGAGYTDFERPAHIFTVPVPESFTGPQKAAQITTGRFSESDISWHPDGTKIYFTSNRDLEPYYKPPEAALYSVAASGGTPAQVAKLDGAIRNFALNPAGTRAAFVAALHGTPVRSYSQPDLWVAPVFGGSPKNLTEAFDNDINSTPGGDQAPPRGGNSAKPVWSADGRFILLNAAEQGRSNLYRFDGETGRMDPLTTGDQSVFSWSASADAGRLALAVSTSTNIGDIYLLETATRKLTRLTNSNDALFGTLNLAEPEAVWYTSFDGRKVQGWVQFPPNRDPKARYPLILNIHGGPHAAYGNTFDHEFHWMAAKGYAVFYPNPRGSTTYGQEFGNLIQHRYPGDDYKDLMAGVDELIRRGWIDPARMGVTGGSGGGVLTNWTIGHTDRFKAAVSQRSIADWRDFWYTADFTLFLPTWFRGAPWEDEADFKARSPITYVDKINTPSMFIEGEADLRTPPGAGGEQMFRALKYRRVPTVMVRFPGETHELSRSGQPSHRVERLEHIVRWFDKYVLGQDIKTYDVE
jgi:dipeptidyl aminopeptidase/acylaminoacyl peptidase